MDPYQKLANAIIQRAAEDYRDALRVLSMNPRDRESHSEKNAIERFFRSGWFGVLTALDGEWLIRKLKEEAQQ